MGLLYAALSWSVTLPQLGAGATIPARCRVDRRRRRRNDPAVIVVVAIGVAIVTGLSLNGIVVVIIFIVVIVVIVVTSASWYARQIGTYGASASDAFAWTPSESR